MFRILDMSSQCILAGGLALAVLVPLHGACAKDGETVLHGFTERSDGGFPGADLLVDEQGNLYGTTERGGSSTNCQSGCGTIFKLAPTAPSPCSIPSAPCRNAPMAGSPMPD